MILSNNLLIFVLDSCRYDTYLEGCDKDLLKIEEPQKAYTTATWTFPSHMSIAMGFFPEVREDKEFYNRFSKQLFRFSSDNYLDEKAQRAKYILTGEHIFDGLKNDGFSTYCNYAVSWLDKTPFKNLFDDAEHIDSAEKQLKKLDAFVRDNNKYAALVNFGETHFPYNCPTIENELSEDIIKKVKDWKPGKNNKLDVDFHYLKRRQIESVIYLTKIISVFLSKLESNVTVVITSDHGECFGEDGLFGHGFYHPMVMEVPLTIFDLCKKY